MEKKEVWNKLKKKKKTLVSNVKTFHKLSISTNYICMCTASIDGGGS